MSICVNFIAHASEQSPSGRDFYANVPPDNNNNYKTDDYDDGIDEDGDDVRDDYCNLGEMFLNGKEKHYVWFSYWDGN